MNKMIINSNSGIYVQGFRSRKVAKKSSSQIKVLFWLSILILFVLSAIYDSPKDLDRLENYRIGMSLFNMSYYDIFDTYFNNGYDFIFYIGLGFSAKYEFGMPVFMGIITALYYVETFKYVNKLRGGLTLNNALLLIGLLSFPSILYVVNLSRSVFALYFFAIGVNKWLLKKYKSHLLFFLISIVTHAGTIIFVSLFYVGILAYSLLKNNSNLTRVLCLILPPSFFILFRTLFLDVLQNDFLINFFFETKYLHYFDATGQAELEGSVGSVLSILGEIGLCYVLINLDKQVTVKKILCLVFTTMTAAFLTVNHNMTNRFILVLPIVYSLYFFELFEKYKTFENRNKGKLDWLYLSSMFCILICSLILFQERKCFFPFIFN